MDEHEVQSKLARGFLLAVLFAIAGLSLFLGVAVCLAALLALLVGDGEVRRAAVGFVIGGGSAILFGWRLLTWLRQHRGPL